jgi:hypothetical protein
LAHATTISPAAQLEDQMVEPALRPAISATRDRAKRSEGFSDQEFELYDKDETEKQVEETPAYASLRLNGGDPRGELARTIIRRLLPDLPRQAPQDDGETPHAMEPLVIGMGLESLARTLFQVQILTRQYLLLDIFVGDPEGVAFRVLGAVSQIGEPTHGFTVLTVLLSSCATNS